MSRKSKQNSTTSPAFRTMNICIVAHLAYGALAGGSSRHFGGVESQTNLMARWFAGRGHRVSVVTWDEGQPDGIEIDGVRVLKMCRRDDGLPGIRFFHPRWTSLHRALVLADADIYYQNCGEYVTGQVALWCRSHLRKFVFSAASDADCDAGLPFLKKVRERVLYRLGIRYADRIIVQTRTQQWMLGQSFGRDAEVIPMPCLDRRDSTFRPPESPGPPSARVLWIGRLCEVKRPDRFLDLAEAVPELQFDLVGPEDGTEYSQRVIDRARHIPNLTVHGPAMHDKVQVFYRRAGCVCSTSDLEGFPNTFLEAWSNGLPVVSTFDPDRIIAEKNLGAVAADVPALASAIRELLVSRDRWCSVSANAREYYKENHSTDRVMPRFERTFLEVVGGSAAAPPARADMDGVTLPSQSEARRR